MNASSRFLAVVAVGGAIALAACGGTDLSPVASSSTAFTSDSGSVTNSGYGPGAPPSPTPSPGTGTCTNDCDGTGQGPGNGYGPGPGPSDGPCGTACTGSVGPDPSDIGEMLALALQEEYKAESLYRSVLGTFGPDTVPFAVIADSEARHVQALKVLFERRQMAPPASIWSSFPPFASVPVACAAGVVAEREDAAFYTPYLGHTDLPQDVKNVFTNLQAASLYNHLPAFQRCQ